MTPRLVIGWRARGRPKEGEKRVPMKTTTIRFAEYEQEKIKQCANRDDMGVSTWIRTKVMEATE